jgi:dihydropyrimidinase
MTYLLIKNGLVINANGQIKADVFIQNNSIQKVEPQISEYPTNTQIIDASGNYIIPGGIDPHVHFHLETPAGFSADNFYTGSKAALAGGTTSIIDFITPQKNQHFKQATEQRLLDAQNCLCNYGFHISPITWNETIPAQMEYAVNEAGINSFKVYMAYKKSIGIEHEVLKKVMHQAAKLNALVTIHAEDGDAIEAMQLKYLAQGNTAPYFHALSRQADTEALAVKKAIDLAAETGAKIYFVHISAQKSLEYIQLAQGKGLPVFAETCPQYLLFTKKKLQGSFNETAPYVFSPALKEASDREALWKGLADGIISTVGTDHCPFNLHGQKNLGLNDFTKIPNGAGGVEFRLALLFTYGVLTGQLSLEQWVALSSTHVAKIFNLPAKGMVANGFDADIIIWNPNVKKTLSNSNQWSVCDSNIYQGMHIQGAPDKVILAGKLVFSEGEINEFKAAYLPRAVFKH